MKAFKQTYFVLFALAASLAPRPASADELNPDSDGARTLVACLIGRHHSEFEANALPGGAVSIWSSSADRDKYGDDVEGVDLPSRTADCPRPDGVEEHELISLTAQFESVGAWIAAARSFAPKWKIESGGERILVDWGRVRAEGRPAIFEADSHLATLDRVARRRPLERRAAEPRYLGQLASTPMAVVGTAVSVLERRYAGFEVQSWLRTYDARTGRLLRLRDLFSTVEIAAAAKEHPLVRRYAGAPGAFAQISRAVTAPTLDRVLSGLMNEFDITWHTFDEFALEGFDADAGKAQVLVAYSGGSEQGYLSVNPFRISLTPTSREFANQLRAAAAYGPGDRRRGFLMGRDPTAQRLCRDLGCEGPWPKDSRVKAP